MAQYDWLSCPVSIRAQIQTFCARIQLILADTLLAIYLHGSLAMGCFNPDRSDIDLLVITKQRLSVETKRLLMELLLRISNAPCPIEISFLVLPDIHPFRHPLPFDLHYSESWRQQTINTLADGSWQQWNDRPRYDPDLAAHLTITYHRGLALFDNPPSELLPAVPTADYAAAIIGDYIDARDCRASNPVYFVLNACRIEAYISAGHIFSKDEGGIYGLESLPGQFHPLIASALATYRGEQDQTSFDMHRLDSFADCMDQLILRGLPA